MIFRSIRFSLTFWYSVTLAVVLVVFSSFLYLIIREQFYHEADRELLTIAEAIASPTMEPFRNSAPSVIDQVLEDFLGPKISNKYVQIFDGTGDVYSRSRNLKDIRLPLTKSTLTEASQGNIVYETVTTPGLYPVRSISFPLFSDGRLSRIIYVGTSLAAETETLDKILLILFITIPTSLLLVGSGGWFLAGRALKPVDLITRSAQKITAENLNQRLEVVNPNDEIGRLAETFNRTLARLDHSFKRTRQFSSDVSHELRTPLTILRGETEVGLRWAKEPEDFRELLRSNLDEIKRMSEIIEYLLELSRIEAGELPLDIQEVDLEELLHEMIGSLEAEASVKGIGLDLIQSGPVFVKGDRLRIKQVFINLLENGMKHTPSGGRVRIILSYAAESATVEFADSGPGIPEEDIPFIFERFYRVDKARNRSHGGLGLGLSIAKSLAEAQGGRIEVSSVLGKGSTFSVHFPRLHFAS
ncbi:cell wall metabolism sensor histidine kinase WalK [Geobacter sp. DSM 9736]|uniref:sensor histidine kinase n=1 Tax=Geobacter sp. DSM 9736 TaxID=1277350 RepID=UPI000B51270C|nr:ATP-binding protein [Geobacter sp. DSM 9736]SNB47580.1 heavy metal sensor kinase [Geobacter sp. DSM 9736]